LGQKWLKKLLVEPDTTHLSNNVAPYELLERLKAFGERDRGARLCRGMGTQLLDVIRGQRHVQIEREDVARLAPAHLGGGLAEDELPWLGHAAP